MIIEIQLKAKTIAAIITPQTKLSSNWLNQLMLDHQNGKLMPLTLNRK